MFGSVRDFFYRHRRKFLIGSGIIGGVLVISKFAEHKLFEWHENQTRAIIEKQKKRQHYEKTRQTANATALSLSHGLIKAVSTELDVDDLLRLISENPEKKILYWQELKILGFSRTISSIYTSALVASFVHCQLVILAAYSFGATSEDKPEIPFQTQEKFLAGLQFFVEKGLPMLIKKIHSATKHRVQSLSLTQKFTLGQLESVLTDITLSLSGEEGYSCIVEEQEKTFILNPWSQFLSESALSFTDDDLLLRKMMLELIDIIDAEDFNTVIQNLVQHGLNHTIDSAAETLPIPTSDQFSRPTATEKSMSPLDKDSKTLDDPLATHSHGNPLVKSSLPLAKLVPVLSDLVSPFLSPAPGQLLQFALLNEQLENLCFNIYESISIK